MAKNVALSDLLVTRLDTLRQRFGISYSAAIELIVVEPEVDLAIVAINKRFVELGSLLPDMCGVWESLNLVAVHMHRLPPQKRIDQTERVVKDILDIVDHIVTQQEERSDDEK